MIKLKFLFSILLLVLISSCGKSGRDLSTPHGRLVGHWATDAGDHLYYSKIDSKTEMGTYILVQPNGNTAKHRYKIVSEIPKGERIIVQLLFASGDSRNDTYYISKDGQLLTKKWVFLGEESSITEKYVDNEISP